jgi:hypothetical protein
LPHRVADRNQFADDPGVLGKDAVAPPARFDFDRSGRAIDHLHQRRALADKVAPLPDFGIIGSLRHGVGRFILEFKINRSRLSIVDFLRKLPDSCGERHLKGLV